ncbi:MAG: hypothetical protein KAX57_08985 [Rhodoferax sp.]|jgi:hypothetical protein|nr:hypothetical protein [Rhodoferax sp.]
MQKKTLFLCSRMEPFGNSKLRGDLLRQFGGTEGRQTGYRLHVENRTLAGGEDARMFCARAIQSSDGVVLILDGSQSMSRAEFEAPVLELEVMLTATCAKPVFVVDGSDGTDPLFRLLGTEFFGGSSAVGAKILAIPGIDPVEKIARLKDVLAQTCEGSGGGAAALAEHVGWENLFLARPDRMDAFDEDGGNFPFAKRGLDVPDMMSSDIALLLNKAEESYKTDKMAALVLAWDAIRALSKRPWGTTQLDSTMALLWLRAWSTWGGAMAWLGLFGHSSGAAVTTNLACLKIASRFDVPETGDGGQFATHKFQGGLASTYFSLSKLVKSMPIQAAIRAKGIGYATDALRHATGARAQAGLLAVRGPLYLSTRSPLGVARGFWDLHASVQLHQKASGGAVDDHGLAASRIQLGAAFKELAKRTFRDPISLRIARVQLETAYDVLAAAHTARKEVDIGQLLMCMKHLVETLWLLRRESEAIDLWQKSLTLATTTGISDQLRQLHDIARVTGWNKSLPSSEHRSG